MSITSKQQEINNNESKVYFGLMNIWWPMNFGIMPIPNSNGFIDIYTDNPYLFANNEKYNLSLANLEELANLNWNDKKNNVQMIIGAITEDLYTAQIGQTTTQFYGFETAVNNKEKSWSIFKKASLINVKSVKKIQLSEKVTKFRIDYLGFETVEITKVNGFDIAHLGPKNNPLFKEDKTINAIKNIDYKIFKFRGLNNQKENNKLLRVIEEYQDILTRLISNDLHRRIILDRTNNPSTLSLIQYDELFRAQVQTLSDVLNSPNREDIHEDWSALLNMLVIVGILNNYERFALLNLDMAIHQAYYVANTIFEIFNEYELSKEDEKLLDKFWKWGEKWNEIAALDSTYVYAGKEHFYPEFKFFEDIMNNQILDEFYPTRKARKMTENSNDEFKELLEEIEEEDKKTQPKKELPKTDEQLKNEENLSRQIENEIHEEINRNMSKQQKEFMLREKLKATKKLLSDINPDSGENNEFSETLKDPKKSKQYPDSVIKLVKNEQERLKGMMAGTPDSNVTQTYINTLVSLPWRKVEIETLDIKKAREILEKNHYGLSEVKERIIEYLALIINHRQLSEKRNAGDLIKLDDTHQIDMALFKENSNPNKIQKNFNNVPILTLVGPPGTGKTSLARAIAEALNKSYIKISLGGVRDEAEIRGHRKTYVGAMPGRLIKAIQKAGVSNPLILLDEIDKMGAADFRGDPSSAMLEVLDPEQNTKFQDNYLEHEYDLSKVMFIATANDLHNIPRPLLDRVELIELSSYTISEKIQIAKEHLIQTVIEQAGLKPEQFQISDQVIEFIIKHYTLEAGVRGLKRTFDKIARKIITKIIQGEKIEKFVIDEKTAKEMLGVPKFTDSERDKEPQVGVVNGLAYTAFGGSTLQIEVTSFKSKEKGLKLTGSLKDVMKESASIALTYVKANAEKFGINPSIFEENEIHIHVPEGAVPKDGPSAGVTFTTALISALSNKPVAQNVAMTGEITLRGRVLEIGGLKEKSFAAYKKGINKVFIPYDNEKNLVDIPQEVKDNIKFIPVKHYEEIYNELFK